MSLEYVTVRNEASDEFTEKRSRFIGYIKPVKTEQEAQEFIASIRSKHWDARHNVFAYRLREGSLARYSDDGEPSGTAGTPVLAVLEKAQVTDAVLVVTRYFGGILLGTGGLVRAYSHAASLALEAGERVIMRMCANCSLTCDYNQYGRLSSLLPSCGCVIDSSSFGAEVELGFHVPPDSLPDFERKLADATNGSVCYKRENEDFYCFFE